MSKCLPYQNIYIYFQLYVNQLRHQMKSWPKNLLIYKTRKASQPAPLKWPVSPSVWARPSTMTLSLGPKNQCQWCEEQQQQQHDATLVIGQHNQPHVDLANRRLQLCCCLKLLLIIARHFVMQAQ